MPRQTFLTRESFVDAPEKQTRDSILLLPAYIDCITLHNEKHGIDACRFSYGPCAKDLYYYIDVSLLPLNDQYTRVSLHASHINGQPFYTDREMSLVLHEFESAIHASVKGELDTFSRFLQPKQQQSKWQQLLAFFRLPVRLQRQP
jgi:hypothetical protein